MAKVVYFQPAQSTFSSSEPLNILLVADSERAENVLFRFYGTVGDGWKELYAEEKAVGIGHTHLYFQLPPCCFGAECWGEIPEELTLLAATEPPAAPGGVLLFRL